MATITASKAFALESYVFDWLLGTKVWANEPIEFTQIRLDEPATIAGQTYQDSIRANTGAPFVIGGHDFVLDSATGQLTGGVIEVIRGSLDLFGRNNPNWQQSNLDSVVQGVSISVADLRKAALTYWFADDSAVMRRELLGNDTFRLSDEDDMARSYGGDDRIWGRGGADTLNGGGGNDRLFGGGGSDYLTGDGGDDRIEGGSANDALFGGDGGDSLNGGSGSDSIEAGAGQDEVRGGSGDDDLWGHEGRDRLLGGAGADEVVGDMGDDVLIAGMGSDFVDGGPGRDTLAGGAGQDELYGGSGGTSGDTYYADGPDRFDFNALTDSGVGRLTRDVVHEFVTGSDLIDLRGIDAQIGSAGTNEAFAWSGDQAAAHSVWWDDLHYVLRADATGDARADFELQIDNAYDFGRGDVLL